MMRPFKTQQELTTAEIDNMKRRPDGGNAMKRGDAMITINGTELQPHQFMFEIHWRRSRSAQTPKGKIPRGDMIFPLGTPPSARIEGAKSSFWEGLARGVEFGGVYGNTLGAA